MIRSKKDPMPAALERALQSLGLPLGGCDCWCGGRLGHDWPGKESGAPHPRGVSDQ